MTTLVTRVKSRFARLNKQDDGLEALQVVLIIALAAIILAFAYNVFGGSSNNDTDTASDDSVVAWVTRVLTNIFSFK